MSKIDAPRINGIILLSGWDLKPEGWDEIIGVVENFDIYNELRVYLQEGYSLFGAEIQGVLDQHLINDHPQTTMLDSDFDDPQGG